MKTKKLLLTITALALSLVTLLSLTACNKYFFEDLGYMLSKKNNTATTSAGDDTASQGNTDISATDPQTNKGYSIKLEFDDDHPITECGYDLMMSMTLASIETTLTVEDGKYVLVKEMFGAESNGEEYSINPDVFYTQYGFYFNFTFTGNCTVNGDKITLEVPEKGTKIAYYCMDVNKLYPSIFPFTSTAVCPEGGDWSGVNTDPVELIEKDYQLAFFGNTFIQKSSECKTQIATFDGNKLVSIEGDASATAIELLSKEETEKAVNGGNEEPETPDEPVTLLTLQREGADCKLYIYEEGKFVFDYKGMVSEEGIYTYEDGMLTMTAKEGASVTVSIDGNIVTVAYVSAASAMLHDEFNVTTEELDKALNTVKVLFRLQRGGAGCSFTMMSDNTFIFDYNNMMQETGTYAYVNGTLTVNAIDGATVEITEEDGIINIHYVAAAGGGRLFDDFAIAKADLETIFNPTVVLFKLQREGAGCSFTMMSDNTFIFDYNNMMQETGTYSYENGTLTVNAIDGATVEITEEDGIINIHYVAAAGGGRLFDDFTVAKAELDGKLA